MQGVRGPAPYPPRPSPTSPQVCPHSPRSRFLLLQLQRLQPVRWGGVGPGRGWHRVSPRKRPRDPVESWGTAKGSRLLGQMGRQAGQGQAAATGALRAQSQGLFRVEQPCSPGNPAWESWAQESLPPRPAPAGEGPAQRPPHPSVSLCTSEAPQNPPPLELLLSAGSMGTGQ